MQYKITSLKLSDSSEFEEDDVQSMGEKQKESGVGTEEILNVSESEYEKTSILDVYALTCWQNKPKILHESISFRYHLYLLTL